MKAAAALLALLLAACGADAIQDRAVPVAMTRALEHGDEVWCVETLLVIRLPSFPAQIVGWARRTFRCELRRKEPG